MTSKPLAVLSVGLALLAAPAAAQDLQDGPEADAVTAADDSVPTAPMTVLDGVYTEEQAERGREIYGENCSSCHGGNLRGSGSMTPGIVGFRFERSWVDLTVADLFGYIREQMPLDNPGMLNDAENAALVAYILFRNDYPAGTTIEIPLDPDAQTLIAIVSQ